MPENAKPISVTFVISGLGPGGAEQVATILANHWAGLSWRVTVLALDRGEMPPYFELASDVVVRRLGLLAESHSIAAALRHTVRRVLVLRAELRRVAPDIVLSFGDRTNVLSLIASAGLGVPIVVTERSDPSGPHVGTLWSWMRRRLYPRATAVVAQSEMALAYFDDTPLRRRVVIGNPILAPAAFPDKSEPVIVGVGRLTREKGFDLLIDAFQRIAPKHPKWALVIYGDGPERQELLHRVVGHGLEKRVLLPGRTDGPRQWIARAAIFVLPSRYEGFPNALGEALAAGLPAVAFDCRCGPREMIEDGRDGLLVPEGDVAALAAALGRLMSDPDLRNRLGAAASRSIRQFSPEVILPRWTDLIAGLAEKRS